MIKETGVFPRVAVRSIAAGMLMMAFFTTLWAGIAFGSLGGMEHGAPLLIFPVLCIAFIANAIYLSVISKRFPKLTSEEDKAEGKKSGMWFGIIFGAEGLLIFLGINIVTNFGHADLSIPVIALVVGLHFYPLAKVFERKIDYYLATWTTVVAIFGILFILKKTYSVEHVDAIVGICTAIATSCYGLYMMYSGWKMDKPAKPSV